MGPVHACHVPSQDATHVPARVPRDSSASQWVVRQGVWNMRGSSSRFSRMKTSDRLHLIKDQQGQEAETYLT